MTYDPEYVPEQFEREYNPEDRFDTFATCSKCGWKGLAEDVSPECPHEEVSVPDADEDITF
jgi:hypothetical protein